MATEAGMEVETNSSHPILKKNKGEEEKKNS